MKTATFYCESCNRPVPLDAEQCPHCGSRFTAVQCPKCSFVGTADLFGDGCPKCGHLAPQQQRTRVASGTDPMHRTRVASRVEPEPKRSMFTPRRAGTRLPGWFYSLAAVLLLAVVAVLIVFAAHGR